MGNVIENYGFESGGFPPWTFADGTTEIKNDAPHTGTYYAYLGKAAMAGFVQQLLSSSIPQDNVIEFYIWASNVQPMARELFCKIIYHNDSTTTWNEDMPSSCGWKKIDFKSKLEAGKGPVKGLMMSGLYLGIDDCMLNVLAIQVNTLPATERTPTTAMLNGEVVSNGEPSISMIVFEYRRIGSEPWKSIYVPVEEVAPYEFGIQVGNLEYLQNYEYKAKAFVIDTWYEGELLTIGGLPEQAPTQYIIRPKSIVIGVSSGENFEWFGIKSVRWGDVTPWVHTDIPYGPMLHQHLRSPHVEGEIVVYDLDALHTALFDTAVDSKGHKAIELNNNRKYTVDYLVIKVVNQAGEILEYQADDFKVETISIEDIELGTEARFIVKFSANKIVVDR